MDDIPMFSQRDLIKALEAAGVHVPENTRSVQLIMEPDEPIILRIEIFANATLLHKISTTVAAYLVAQRLVK